MLVECARSGGIIDYRDDIAELRRMRRVMRADEPLCRH